MAPTAEANERAIEHVLASEPWLIGVRPAGEVVPSVSADTILHAAPPTSWDDMSDLLRGGVIGAALFEGLAATPEEAEKAAAEGRDRSPGRPGPLGDGRRRRLHHRLPALLVLEDRTNGRRAFHFLMEGFGRTLILGMFDEDVLARLRWFRDELGPALDAAIRAVGGIDVRAVMAEALRRGDELHNRNAAATSMLAERLAPGFAARGRRPRPPGTDLSSYSAKTRSSSSPSRSRRHGSRWTRPTGSRARASSPPSERTGAIAGSRSRASASAGSWPRPRFPKESSWRASAPEDAGPGCGDSLLVECCGLGAAVLPAAPALWPLVGADEARARAIFEDTGRIALGEHPHYRIPVLGDRGAPTGIDVLRVVETGIRPVIDIVMLHREQGRGMIGFGLTSPPFSCFEQAAAAFRERYG